MQNTKYLCSKNAMYSKYKYFSEHGLKCYEKGYTSDKKMKTVSCDSQYCEYRNGTARCGTFEPIFIPYDYCVVGFRTKGTNKYLEEAHMQEVSLFIEENNHSRTCSTSRTVLVSVQRKIATILRI